MPRLALYALTVCVLSVAAAVVSFVQGSWLGIVWVLLAGLSSNMTWYYARRGRRVLGQRLIVQYSLTPSQKRYRF